MSIKFTRTDVRKRLSATKGRGLKGVLRNEDGAIDLASIMVGVVVVGIIGSVIGASVFAVIPWAQNQAAEQSLDAVRTAQSVAQGAAATGTGAAFLDKAALVNGVPGNQLTAKGLLQDSDSIAILADANGYVAASKSKSGSIYWISSAAPTKVNEVKPGADAAATLTALNTASGKVFTAANFAAAKA